MFLKKIIISSLLVVSSSYGIKYYTDGKPIYEPINVIEYPMDVIVEPIQPDSSSGDTFWTGNGSIMSRHKKLVNQSDNQWPYGVTKDVTMLHSKSDKPPVGFFQWFKSDYCKKLKITSNVSSSEKVNITIGSWRYKGGQVTLNNVKLPFVLGNTNLGTFLDKAIWNVVGIKFLNPMSSKKQLNAECVQNVNATYVDSRSVTTPLMIGEYRWNGNGSIISRIFESHFDTLPSKINNNAYYGTTEWPYGVFKDVSMVYKDGGKQAVFFQWMSSDRCSKLLLDATLSNDQQVTLKYKNWNSSSVIEKDIELPYTLHSEGRLWNVLGIYFDDVERDSKVTAKCVNYRF